MPNKDMNDILLKDKLNTLLCDLPPICSNYFTARISLSPRTKVDYAYKFQYFFVYLHTSNPYFKKKEIKEVTAEDLDLLTPEDIDEFSAWLNAHRDFDNIEKNTQKNSIHTNNINSIKHYLSCLNTFFAFMHKRGYISSNPIALVERGPKRKKKAEIIRLYDNEKQQFMETVINGNGLSNRQMIYHEKNKIRDKAIYQLFLDTGLRISELQGINLEDVNYFEHYVYVARKGEKYNTVYFSDYTQAYILDYLAIRQQYYPTDDERALFLSQKGTRIAIRTIQAMTKKYSSVSIPGKATKITPHKFRATYATDLLNVTGNLELTSQQLGHESVQTTLLYAETDRETRKAVRNILYSPKNMPK